MAERRQSGESRPSAPGEPERHAAVPNTYDRTTDLDLWLRQFNVCTTANSWDDLRKVQFLSTRLRGKALFAFASLDEPDGKSFEEVVSSVRTAVQPPELQGVLRIDVWKRKKMANETLDNYFQKLSFGNNFPNLFS